MIDDEGYRPNVGIVLLNKAGRVFWGLRVTKDAWQFPQGGIRHYETPQQAMFRELHEEVGLKPQDVRVLGKTEDWLHYQLPQHLVRKNQEPLCIGQKQIWFLLGLESDDSAINLFAHDKPEFIEWTWVDYWYPVSQIVDFKQNTYQQALSQLELLKDRFWLTPLPK